MSSQILLNVLLFVLGILNGSYFSVTQFTDKKLFKSNVILTGLFLVSLLGMSVDFILLSSQISASISAHTGSVLVCLNLIFSYTIGYCFIRKIILAFSE